MNQDNRLSGKRALVTGAGTGIGREVALELARQGADVVVHYSHSETGAMAVVEEIHAMGRRAALLPADFARPDEVVALSQKAIEFLGGIDCLVNNAGISFAKPFLDVQPEQLDLLFHVNFYAQFLLTQQVARQMLDRGRRRLLRLDVAQAGLPHGNGCTLGRWIRSRCLGPAIE